MTEETKKHEDEPQKETKSAPQNEPVDPLGSGCGFIPGEGI
ncbi:hypothetical protein [Nitrobacter sp.]